MNSTHDPERRSWIESANAPDTDFPIQNLPYGVYIQDQEDEPHVCVAIGDQILDLCICAEAGLYDSINECLADAFDWRLNVLMHFNPTLWSLVRERTCELLTEGCTELKDNQAIVEAALKPMDSVQMLNPVDVNDYTDFYASIHHATNVGSMFRPDNPLLPNYKWIPIGYHGRASSLVPSHTPIRRPCGQTRASDDAPPTYGPCKLLDYEMEVGFYVGGSNRIGEAISIDEAEDHLFGMTLVNDWSARDMQKWEYQPLGPFLAKSFATTVSPWVVTMDALEPFRCAAFERDADDPQPLPYLDSENNRTRGGVDMTVEVYIASMTMRANGIEPMKLSSGSFKNMYWTIAQMLTHHASNGCNLQPGDMMASGTVSGPEKHNRGCLLELTWRGSEPIELPTGETRKFIEDGDEIIMRGYCEREGYRRIGFGECRGIVLPVHD